MASPTRRRSRSVADELARDRQVRRLADGAVEAADDHGFALRFQVTVRRTLDLPGERINAPGSPAAARRQSDRRLAGHAGQAAHALARRLLRA